MTGMPPSVRPRKPLHDTSVAELRWLCRQTKPVWGGHIERGEPVEVTALWPLVRDGIIERWDTDWDKGYRATARAKSLAA